MVLNEQDMHKISRKHDSMSAEPEAYSLNINDSDESNRVTAVSQKNKDLYLQRYDNHKNPFFFCRQNMLDEKEASPNQDNTCEHQGTFQPGRYFHNARVCVFESNKPWK